MIPSVCTELVLNHRRFIVRLVLAIGFGCGGGQEGLRQPTALAAWYEKSLILDQQQAF
jgi:hypothetical protein